MTISITPEEAKRAEESFGMKPPGRYLCEVSKDEERISQSGKGQYVNLEFIAVGGDFDGEIICWDVAMLSGKGMGIGIIKLRALGVDWTKPFRYQSGDLRGRRVYLTLVEDSFAKADGTVTKKLKPVFDRDKNFGYNSIDGAVELKAASTQETEDCTCGHDRISHDAAGKCSGQGCACVEFDLLPF